MLLVNPLVYVPVNLWDNRIASEMKNVIEIFTELGDTKTIFVLTGKCWIQIDTF